MEPLHFYKFDMLQYKDPNISHQNMVTHTQHAHIQLL